jgi:hypothetical protein
MLASTLRTTARPSAALAATVLASIAACATPALARGEPGRGGDRPEVRVAGVCAKGATSSLRITARDGGIETEFQVHGRRGLWRVTLVHERQVAWRGKRWPAGPNRWFVVEYKLPDWSGADMVSARAVGPSGGVCAATATLPG